MLKEIARLRDEPVPEQELALQRQYNVGNYLLSLENTQPHRAARAGHRPLRPARRFLQDLRATHGRDAATVTELAKKYLTAENVAIVVVGEAKEIQPELEKIGKVIVYDTT